MNLVTLGIGSIVLCFGVVSGIFWFMKPEVFKKLEAMKKKWGNKIGSIWHFSAYVIVPIVFGVIVIIAGINGVNFLALLK